MPFDMIPPRAIVFDCSRSNTTDYNRTLRFCLYFLTFTGRRAIRWFIWRLLWDCAFSTFYKSVYKAV